MERTEVLCCALRWSISRHVFDRTAPAADGLALLQ
jgi:hypothetical protein